jgi:hypothetical protein
MLAKADTLEHEKAHTIKFSGILRNAKIIIEDN